MLGYRAKVNSVIGIKTVINFNLCDFFVCFYQQDFNVSIGFS